MSDVVRRKFDASSSSSSAASKPSASSTTTSALPAPTKLLSARTSKLAFDQLVGKHALVQSASLSASAQTQAGFYCSLCDRLLKDSQSYLDHLNSPFHLKLAGHKLEIKRATLHDVRARLAMHKRRKLEMAHAQVYDLDKRVELVKAQMEAEKLARKERKRQLKEEQRRAREQGGGAVGRRKRMRKREKEGEDVFASDSNEEEEHDGQEGASSSGSEYSDYEIDEHGNIIEPDPATKPVKKKRRVDDQEDVPDVGDNVDEVDVAAMMGFGSFGSSSK
ncbi:hypothetical protein BCR44DRAFT_42021 [Catenaria anguillulae PL171]|uniref:C2H2-type domain-containing protein n=1 Tax=Catenaria anguillulae PL171 TaxID=765915 RepID=A0A1Y2HC29_9FUNG|nr:hypothetical protein BCR44DRAFT_42021 [Catenaria anguillulae PL171]